MGLDIRLPIGLLFSVIGLLLAGFGVFSEQGIYVRSLGFNVNLAWGVVLLVFGIVMVIFGNRRSRLLFRAQHSSDGAGHSTSGRR